MTKYIVMQKNNRGDFIPCSFEDGVLPIYTDFKEAAVMASKLHNKANDTFVFALTESMVILNNNETIVAIK